MKRKNIWLGILVLSCVSLVGACTSTGNDDDDDDPTSASNSVCSADAAAEGGDVICYTLDGGEVVRVVESDGSNDVYGYYTTTEATDEIAGSHKIVLSVSPVRPGVEVLFADSSTGTHSSESAGNRLRYQEGVFPFTLYAISSSCGSGSVNVTQYAEVGGRLQGTFEAELYLYNFNGTNNDHTFNCDSQKTLVGAFDVTRDADGSHDE